MIVCGECAFWRHDDATQDEGECRLEPPKVFAVPMIGIPPGLQTHAGQPVAVSIGIAVQTVFPRTKHNMGCGCGILAELPKAN